MLVGGSLVMLSMAAVGGMMANYGWREAQEEELDAVLRAAVSAAAHLMRGDITTVEEEIRERVAGFMRGLLDDIVVDKNDVVVEHDFSTNRTSVRIEGDATYAFKSLWAAGGTGDPESLSGTGVVVEFDASQFEFALALDVSPSMGLVPGGWSITRLDALKDAIRTIAQTVDAVSRTNLGIITLSLVPFSNVVNVADTSGTWQTEAKERYVRMLTGAEYSTQISRDTEAHWVDAFHYYGTGADMGPLVSRDLPDFLSVTDWDLHRPGADDISRQAPTLGMWDFEGSDFWNGCVMARWGAYWHPDARPAAWDPGDPDNWPARKTVAGWAPDSTGISGLPLHLSDAPPDASDPNSRFTAFSWPDARIGGLADHQLADIMWRVLDPDRRPAFLFGTSENHWHLRAVDRGGSLLCPEATIVPLTDDITALQAADHYRVVQFQSETASAQTFLHLGIVWGLRTLSPLWRNVWKTASISGDNLPRTPCLEGGTVENCSPLVEKAIVIVSDGTNSFGAPSRARTFGQQEVGYPVTRNPDFGFSSGSCHNIVRRSTRYPAFFAASTAEDPATFANSFDVEPNGVFTPAGLSALLDSFQASHPQLSTLDPNIPAQQLIIHAHRVVWENALRDMTPWQLFRGRDGNSPTSNVDATDVLVDPANLFELVGRPVHNSHFCRPSTPLSAYGRSHDLVRVGDGPPVADVAPFAHPTWSLASSSLLSMLQDYQATMNDRLDDWFLEACDIAGRRGVRIHAIYIGGDRTPTEKAAVALLEECVDRGYGGNPLVEEVHATPTATELKAAIESIMDIRRTLRFIDE